MYSMSDLSSRGRNPDDAIVAKELAVAVAVVVVETAGEGGVFEERERVVW